MNARTFALATIVFTAASPAFADAAKRPQDRPAVREQTLLQELTAGMREILVTVAPDIALPKLELKLPTLDGR
jgi:hypothetical protein